MSKTTKVITKEELFTVPLPIGTETYTVISYKFIIDTIADKLKLEGYNIVNENYRATSNLQIAKGTYVIEHTLNPGKYFTFNWVNSYDKSTKFSCAVGGYITENEASVIGKEIKPFIRKHTGNADELALATIINMINDIEEYALTIIEHKTLMQSYTIEKEHIAHILGELFVLHDIVTIEQLSNIKKEVIKPTYLFMDVEPNSLWNLYCNILTVIKSSHPKTWLNQQRFIHNYLLMHMDKYPLPKERVEWVDDLEYTAEPISMEEATIREEVEEEAVTFLEKLEEAMIEDVKTIEPKIWAREPSENQVTDMNVINKIKEKLEAGLGYTDGFYVTLDDDTYTIEMFDGEELFIDVNNL